MEFKRELWEHQKKALKLSEGKNNFGLLFDVGTGKSATLINILRKKFMEKKRVMKTLIVSPPITLTNWKREWELNSKIGDRVTILSGSEKDRLKLMEKPTEIIVTNYESLLMKTLYERLLHHGFEVVVLDESHKIKQMSAKRTKAAIKLGDFTAYKYILTGSPVLNTPMDIFSQYRFLDGGETFGKNFFAFRATYFYDANAAMPRDRYFPNWKIRPNSLEEINQKIYTKAMRVTKAECLDLPKLVKIQIEVELSSEQRRVYEEMKRDFIACLKGEVIVTTLAITKALKLQQIVSGFINVDSEQTLKFDENPRQKALSELLETICVSNKVLVWCSFIENYKQVAKVCEALKLSYVEVHGQIPAKAKQEAVDKFTSDKECKVFIGHPGSAGIGINLVEAAYSIWYSRSFSLEHEIQAEARNYRAGSEIHDKITRFDIVAKNTIDEHIMKALANKQEISEKLLQELALKI